MNDYQLMPSKRHVMRLRDATCIPFAEDNTDYQTYLRWLEAGNTPLPADEPETN